VILVDANLLVYAVKPEEPQHERSFEWLNVRLRGTARVGLPWPALLAFIRVAANPRVMEKPISTAQGVAQVVRWLEQRTAWVPAPTERHAQVLATMLEGQAGHNLVPDAHLAALAIEHGLILCTADRGFARFPGLRWENPLD
jgi:toxin-antitoxin system PIN domain toxin